ncbi:MAG: tetratricopeptide repeat protein, partial [bacterium]
MAAVGQQDYAGAETLLAEAVKRCPSDAEARRHYAAVLWQRGERPAALAQVEEGLRIAPDDGATLLAGGRMALEMGLLDDADRMAEAALRAAPRSAEAWHLHG